MKGKVTPRKGENPRPSPQVDILCISPLYDNRKHINYLTKLAIA